MPNYNSIEGNVLFPTIDGYDMHKAGDMALYLAHCDFYPFKSVIDNNKMAIDLVTKAYRDMAQEAREKDDFRTESWAMTSGTLQACRVDILTQYSLLLTMVSLLEEAVPATMTPVAVIRSGRLTLELSNDISESLLCRLLQEVLHA